MILKQSQKFYISKKERLMKTFFKLIKINHWVKNLFIFAPLTFSLHLFDLISLIRAIIIFFSFSFVSVFVYIINDIKDKEIDLAHPQKALRPIASGKIKPVTALFIGTLFCITGIIIALYINLLTVLILLTYFLINILYSFKLKNIVILDVFIIAAGFCLRVLIGSVAINVPLSNWMLLTTFTISLMLGFGKRRHELVLLKDNADNHRGILSEYNKEILEIMIIISTSITAISYALYTMESAAIDKFNTKHLILTVPIVIFGLFRYLLLVYRKDKGGAPEKLVISDPGIIFAVILWFLVILFLLYFNNQIFFVNLKRILI